MAALQKSYTLLAPVYDVLLRRASRPLRARSLARLSGRGGRRVLIAGIGTGLDVPLLPAGHDYVGIDLTRAMLDRVPRGHPAPTLVQGNAMHLPFCDDCFDAAIMHLIIAVVSEPARCLAEAARVLKPGGRMLVLDKFLRPGEIAPLRRALNALSRRVATRLDVVFEELLPAAPELAVVSDEPALARGWFRLIELEKR